MNAFRVFLLAIWVLLVAITWRAVAELGFAGGNVFISDFAHPWRAQFNADFVLHLLLLAVWVFWRESSKVVGAICGALCVFGGVFTFLYLAVAVHRARGDARALLLGAHA